MAIFGNFSELPFPEVITMLSQRSGKLEIWQVPSQKRYELFLNQGSIQSLGINGHALSDTLQVRAAFTELTTFQTGLFEFNRIDQSVLPMQIQLPLQPLLMSSIAMVDELSHYREYLPHPDTCFRFSAQADMLLLEADAFVAHALPYLQSTQGGSSRQLSQHLNIALESVQLSLYKLRAAGTIEPLRAFEAQTHQQAAHSQQQPSNTPAATVETSTSPSLIRRLLSALGFGKRG